MLNRDYTAPGIAAVVLAILFPVYWISAFNLGDQSFLDAYRADVLSLTLSDLLFVVIGALEIYLYLSLRRAFAARLNGSLVSVLLIMLAVVVAVFHLTVIADVIYAVAGSTMSQAAVNSLLILSGVIALGALVVYAILGFILAIALLLPATAAPVVIKLFAILLLLYCIFQLTIVLAMVNVFLFPFVVLTLAVFFLRDDHVVEVV